MNDWNIHTYPLGKNETSVIAVLTLLWGKKKKASLVYRVILFLNFSREISLKAFGTEDIDYELKKK